MLINEYVYLKYFIYLLISVDDRVFFYFGQSVITVHTSIRNQQPEKGRFLSAMLERHGERKWLNKAKNPVPPSDRA
jgi:hypothetical protein